MKNVSRLTKLRKAFFNGAALTEKQISYQFNLANPRAAVSRLRTRDGMSIYADQFTNNRGETYTKYHLGTPSRKVVAAGYRALALGI